jgi:hypothetical protein
MMKLSPAFFTLASLLLASIAKPLDNTGVSMADVASASKENNPASVGQSDPSLWGVFMPKEMPRLTPELTDKMLTKPNFSSNDKPGLGSMTPPNGYGPDTLKSGRVVRGISTPPSQRPFKPSAIRAFVTLQDIRNVMYGNTFPMNG